MIALQEVEAHWTRSGEVDQAAAIGELLPLGQEVEDVDPSRARQVVLEPGQSSLHHGWLVHASDANSSDDHRIGLALNYVAPHMCQTKAAGETATLVRGVDRYGHFPPEPAYAGDFDPAVLAFQREADRQKLDFTRKAAGS